MRLKSRQKAATLAANCGKRLLLIIIIELLVAAHWVQSWTQSETQQLQSANLIPQPQRPLPFTNALNNNTILLNDADNQKATTSDTQRRQQQQQQAQLLQQHHQDQQFPLYLRASATIACVIILTVGVAGNLLVPLVVVKTKHLRNSTNLFLINLSVADLLVLVVCMPTVLIELHSRPETWLLGSAMCKLSNYVEMLAANGSILTILAISFERYYAICKPLKAGYKCTRVRALFIICLIWLSATLFTLPIAQMATSSTTVYIDGSQVQNCILETDQVWHKVYIFGSWLTFFCLPLVVLMLVYWLIARRLVRDTLALNGGSCASNTSGGGGSCATNTSKSCKSKHHLKLPAAPSDFSTSDASGDVKAAEVVVAEKRNHYTTKRPTSVSWRALSFDAASTNTSSVSRPEGTRRGSIAIFEEEELQQKNQQEDEIKDNVCNERRHSVGNENDTEERVGLCKAAVNGTAGPGANDNDHNDDNDDNDDDDDESHHRHHGNHGHHSHDYGDDIALPATTIVSTAGPAGGKFRQLRAQLKRARQWHSEGQPSVESHCQANSTNHRHNNHNQSSTTNSTSSKDICSKRQQMDSRRQVVVMLGFVVACFFLLLFPYRLFTIWLLLSSEDQVTSLGMETYYNLTYTTRILIYLHSSINPIAYNMISTKFRRAFVAILWAGKRHSQTSRLSSAGVEFAAPQQLGAYAANNNNNHTHYHTNTHIHSFNHFHLNNHKKVHTKLIRQPGIDQPVQT